MENNIKKLINELIVELQSKKRDFYDCYSTKETLLVREWNKAIDECIDTIKNKSINFE